MPLPQITEAGTKGARRPLCSPPPIGCAADSGGVRSKRSCLWQHLPCNRFISVPAAKWAPSNGRSTDRATLLATTIATMLFPEEQPGAGEEAQHFVHRLRMRYQREVLAPLRLALQIPEVGPVPVAGWGGVQMLPSPACSGQLWPQLTRLPLWLQVHMSAQQWERIEYKRVSSNVPVPPASVCLMAPFWPCPRHMRPLCSSC